MSDKWIGGVGVTPVQGFLQTYSEEPGKYIYIFFWNGKWNPVLKILFSPDFLQAGATKVVFFFSEDVSQSVKKIHVICV